MTIKFDICRPDHLFASAWGLAVLGYTLAFGVPSLEVLLWILLFALFFSGGAVASFIFPLPRQKSATRPAHLGVAVAILSASSLYYAVQVILYILNSGLGLLALAEIRQAALGGDPVISNSNILITAVQMNFCLALLGYIKARLMLQTASRILPKTEASGAWRHKRAYFLCAVLSLLISLLDGSRAFFLMGTICIVISQLIMRVYRARVAAVFALMFVTVFSVTFPFVRPEVESAFDGFKYTMVYFAGGIGSLDYALAGSVRVYWQDFEAIANKLGAVLPGIGGYDLTMLRMDMVDIAPGLQTNVFTALGVYHEYLGFVTFLFAMGMGAFSAFLGRLAHRSPGYLFIYAFIAASTILSLFHEYYLATFYLLIKVAVLLMMLKISAAVAARITGMFRQALSSSGDGVADSKQGQSPT